MTTGVTDSGFVRKSIEEIMQTIQERILAIDSNFIIESTSFWGQFQGICADASEDLWLLFESVRASRDPRTARGISQDEVFRLNNLFRLKPAYSFIYDYKIMGEEGTIIPEGTTFASVQDGNIKFETTEQHAIPASEEIFVTLKCTQTGDFNVPAGTVTFIESGLDITVEHIKPATGGRGLETDDEFSLRRQEYLVTVLGSTEGGIKRALSALNEDTTKSQLEFIDVISNRTTATDDRGRPAHAVECLILGGADRDDEIAKTIREAVAAGTPIYGELPNVTVLDNKGREHEVSWTNPTGVNVYVRVTVTLASSQTLNAEEIDGIKLAIVNQGNRLKVGQNVTVTGGAYPLGNVVQHHKIASAAVEVSKDAVNWFSAIVIEDGMNAIPEYSIFNKSNVDIIQ